ncbi:MAG: glycine cleavage system protein GcvH [Oligoflexales bacterium]
MATKTLPNDYKYTKDHEWVSTDDDGIATVGITSYAIEQLGDIVFLELPKVGDTFEAGAPFGTIESTKTVSDLYAPLTGKIVEINESLTGDNLEELTDDPFNAGWLVKVESEGGNDELMSKKDYEKFIKED